MLTNRSVPVDTVLPHLVYQDVAAAIRWLTDTLGFAEHYRYGPPDHPQGAQMRRGAVAIMLTSAREGRGSPAQMGGWTQSLSVFVDDVDALYVQVKARGVAFLEDIHEVMYGERQFVVLDPEGHQWLLSQHVKDVAPQEWGARLG